MLLIGSEASAVSALAAIDVTGQLLEHGDEKLLVSYGSVTGQHQLRGI